MLLNENYTQLRLLEDWAEELIRTYFRSLAIEPSYPIPIYDIAEKMLHLKCDFEVLVDKLSKTSALIIPKKRWILVNKYHNIERQRFSVAHEVAHWLIEGQPRAMSVDSRISITSFRRSDYVMRERIANHFASRMLMPRFLIEQEVGTTIAPKQIIVEELAQRFGVSKAALRIRLEQLGYEGEYMTLGNRNLENVPNLFSDIRNRFAIFQPALKVIDNRFVSAIQDRDSTRSNYIIIERRNLDLCEVFIDLKDIDGFIIVRDFNIDYVNELRAKMPDVKWQSFPHHDEYYGSLFKAREDTDACCSKDVVYFRDDEDGRGHQLQLDSLSRYVNTALPQPTRMQAREFIRATQKQQRHVVIATGCFDLITNAHVRFLKNAKAMGDVLVVGIENDTRIRHFKGPHRPVNTSSQRLEVLRAFSFVDYAFVIHGSPKSPVKKFYTNLHRFLGANILAVSEGDPHLNDRRAEIEAAGGRLAVVSPMEEGSTTAILRKFLAETEMSDIVFVRKRTLYDWKLREESPWQQLVLPLEI